MMSAPTRRQFLAASLALGAGALAACANQAPQLSQGTAAPGATPAQSATTRVVDHLMGAIAIPADPQRVITLHDLGLTTMALHLGFQPIGSQGRIGAHGEETFALGVGFSADGLTHVGAFNALNMERIVALKPDLIIGRSYEAQIYDQLNQIAPTVLVPDDTVVDPIAYSAYLADLLNRRERHQALLTQYEQRIEAIRSLVPNAQDVYVTTLIMNDANGVVQMFGGSLPIDRVLRDVGFQRRKAVRTMEERYTVSMNRYELSLEALPDIDADFVFNNYWMEPGWSSLDESRVVETGPLWQQLNAVKNRQYINSWGDTVYGDGMFYLLNAANLVQTHIGERTFVTHSGGWD